MKKRFRIQNIFKKKETQKTLQELQRDFEEAERIYRMKCESRGKDHPETYEAMLHYVMASAEMESMIDAEES